MTRGICLINASLQGGDTLETLFSGCGFCVWTPQSSNDPSIYTSALCLVIDLSGDAAYRTLQLFRDYGVETPALLIVDPGAEVDVSDLPCSHVMDVIPRDANPLRIMRWIHFLLTTECALEPVQRLSA